MSPHPESRTRTEIEARSMLEPQRHRQLLVCDPPPWYRHRSGSSMDSSTDSSTDSSHSLARVITEMRDEIKKLEAENRELRGRRAAEENPYLTLRRNPSAPALKGQNKEKTVMTVRRYSTNSSLSRVTTREPDRAPRSDSGWRRLQEEMQQQNSSFGHSAGGEEGKVTNRHSLQEYVHKNRAKVKTVTFLLPVDDIYTNRPVLTKHQEGSKITELASITETDS